MDFKHQRNIYQIVHKLFTNLRTNYKLLEVLLEYAGVLVCIRRGHDADEHAASRVRRSPLPRQPTGNAATRCWPLQRRKAMRFAVAGKFG